MLSGQRISGVHAIDPDGESVFQAYCDLTTAARRGIVFQKRLNGSVDFNCTCNDHKNGFADFLISEFWLGLDNIHGLTRNDPFLWPAGNFARISLCFCYFYFFTLQVYSLLFAI